MSVPGVAAVCLLVHIQSVLNLPLVPSPILLHGEPIWNTLNTDDHQTVPTSVHNVALTKGNNLPNPFYTGDNSPPQKGDNSLQKGHDSDISVQYMKVRQVHHSSGPPGSFKAHAQLLNKLPLLPSALQSQQFTKSKPTEKHKQWANKRRLIQSLTGSNKLLTTRHQAGSRHSVNTPIIIPSQSNWIGVHSKKIGYKQLENSGKSSETVSYEEIPKHAKTSAIDSRSSGSKNNVNTYTEVLASSPMLQLAVRSDLDTSSQGEGHTQTSEMLLTVGTGLAALFSLGLLIGLFGCCCKKPRTLEVDANNEKSLVDMQKTSEVFNPSDLPIGDKDLDEEPVSFRDKIKAMDNKLIIPSPDKRQSQQTTDQGNKRRSQQLSPDQPGYRLSLNDLNMIQQGGAQTKGPKITVSDDDAKRDQSQSTGDNISKSDTQDDISDKIFDNISTHSSVSQPFNPDVVIADSDEDEGEFAELQRGTVILKSFQRAKPPRNRSPATRTSKGKIRKSRPNVHNSSATSRSQDTSRDRTPGSTPSSSSFPVSLATPDSLGSDKNEPSRAEKSNSLDNKSADKSVDKGSDKLKGASKNKSGSKSSLDKNRDTDKAMSKSSIEAPRSTKASKESPIMLRSNNDNQMTKSNIESAIMSRSVVDNIMTRSNIENPMSKSTIETPMTKSSDFNDFDSLMSRSVTSIGSDIVIPVKRNGKYTKLTNSPNRGDRNLSPSQVMKNKEREATEAERGNESPSRYRKTSNSRESPSSKRKHRRRDRELEMRAASSVNSSNSNADAMEHMDIMSSSVPNRLSGHSGTAPKPQNASNNIFYLIDPTVKNKCKSQGDVNGDKKTTDDINKDAQKAVKHKLPDIQTSTVKDQCNEQVSPLKRERTTSDPSRNATSEQTHL